VRYLAVRIGRQQEVIADLVTVDSEDRVGKTLCEPRRTFGEKDPHGIRIDEDIARQGRFRN
jgi:hypothetical protein